jgi:hypothetical protein
MCNVVVGVMQVVGHGNLDASKMRDGLFSGRELRDISAIRSSSDAARVL